MSKRSVHFSASLSRWANFRFSLGAAIIGLILGNAPRAFADLPAELEAIVDSSMAAHHIPGALVGVWRGDTPVAVFEKGVSDLGNSTPISRLDSLRIASITKSFTITRLLQLQDAHQLNLDQPISQYVSGLKNGNATLRQLANMTSGIFNYSEDVPFATAFFNNPTASTTDQQIVNVANAHDPYFAPGAGWHYSNTNTVLLGMVIANVTTHPVGDEITNHVISPLGLNGTIYPTAVTLPPPFSRGYFYDGPADPLLDFTLSSPTFPSTSGAMVSHLDDLNIWAKVLATGSLISPEAQAERLEMVSTDGGIGPEYDAYGLGIGMLDGWLGHTGDFPGYQSLLMYDPAHDQTVVIMINLSNDGHPPTKMFRAMAPLLVVPEPSATWLVAAVAGITLVFSRRLRRT